MYSNTVAPYQRLTATFLLSILVHLLLPGSLNITIPLYSYGTMTTRDALLVQESLDADKHALLYNSPKNIIFVGDILLARNVELLMDRHGSDYPYRGIDLERLFSGSYIFGNFEASIPESHKPTKINQLDFSVSEVHLDSLKKAGFSHLSLANNHSNDFGESGFSNTKKVLQAAQLEYSGSANELTYDSVSLHSIQDFVVAVISLETLSDWYSEETLHKVFSYSEQISDFQIVYIHWGDEYKLISNNQQRSQATELVRHGADLIVGHHPHVVQEVGIIDGVPVFYSLGNFIFDQYYNEHVTTGLMLDLHFGNETTIDILPVQSKQLSQPELLSGKNRQSVLDDLAARSNSHGSKSIRQGFVTIKAPFTSQAKIARID